MEIRWGMTKLAWYFLTSSSLLWSSKSSWQYVRHSAWYTAAKSLINTFLLIIPITYKYQKKNVHVWDTNMHNFHKKHILLSLHYKLLLTSKPEAWPKNSTVKKLKKHIQTLIHTTKFEYQLWSLHTSLYWIHLIPLNQCSAYLSQRI